ARDRAGYRARGATPGSEARAAGHDAAGPPDPVWVPCVGTGTQGKAWHAHQAIPHRSSGMSQPVVRTPLPAPILGPTSHSGGSRMDTGNPEVQAALRRSATARGGTVPLALEAGRRPPGQSHRRLALGAAR